ncbi:hypothetical protein COY16_00835 [Candidatus Roizmanbacteria bacterium CG_4_10_14_0_2_um_filter_39_13]|uniref:Glycosyl transferase family 1 domain-containing protein n=1 Tax=Candidatus Roizmanbacteria bacterium CG_4_10_14_0_2_um_filter_39_13 TaxID=1974825 RepID=A0A2M7U1D6_9BACT|nr:MAG: hypothetical protein COY16_00835 [Candidatus Roizmanbacteria bacterium CG_4_10_14_0_2_um_filter_39_13]
MKSLLLLGSVASPAPPKKQGGTERVAYYQAKLLASQGVNIIFVGGKGSAQNFTDELVHEKADSHGILSRIEFVEIGGGTQFGNAADAIELDKSKIEASRKMRLEMTYLAQVQQLVMDRKDDYSFILNNMRGEAALIPLAATLHKPFINVMHLNIFEELADIFAQYKTHIITIGKHQADAFPHLNHLATIPNPINVSTFTFENSPDNYALMLSTIAYHKNQKDAILAAQKAHIPLILSGKIRDEDYFKDEIEPHIDGVNVIYKKELDFKVKSKLYSKAKVFLFPIKWEEPFGLVVIEALASGTPVIAYPHGEVAEIIKDGKTGFLVNNADEMAEKINQIDSIDRNACRQDVTERFDEEVVGELYFKHLKSFMQ